MSETKRGKAFVEIILQHHGIKGQKWGINKEGSTSGNEEMQKAVIKDMMSSLEDTFKLSLSDDQKEQVANDAINMANELEKLRGK